MTKKPVMYRVKDLKAVDNSSQNADVPQDLWILQSRCGDSRNSNKGLYTILQKQCINCCVDIFCPPYNQLLLHNR